ncbi:MAG: hypothetical protein AB1512_24390 [Thermodesulfobacteriota bacterium]
MQFLFRKPRFPIIIDTGKGLAGVRSWAECERLFDMTAFSDNEPKPVIDVTAEGFALNPDMMVISPLTGKKQWTKGEIIELYNRCVKKPEARAYELRSLGNKRVEVVVSEIVDLLRRP